MPLGIKPGSGFDRIYGGWWDTIVDRDANGVVQRSAARYIKAIKDAAIAD